MMFQSRFLRAATLTGLLALSPALAQDNKPDSEIARYCAALAPSASEARAAYQMARLADLEAQAREAVEKLEAKENAIRDWVTKREDMMKSASDDLVAIYAKMAADAAATQIGAMDDNVAAALLMKLNPRAASAILGEMQADKAAKLTSLIAGVAPENKS